MIAVAALALGCAYNTEETITSEATECSVTYATQPGCEGVPGDCNDMWWHTNGWDWQVVGQPLEVNAHVGPGQVATVTVSANVSLAPSIGGFVGLVATQEDSVQEVVGGEVFHRNLNNEPLSYEDWPVHITGVWDVEGDYTFTLRARTVQEEGSLTLGGAATLVVTVCDKEN